MALKNGNPIPIAIPYSIGIGQALKVSLKKGTYKGTYSLLFFYILKKSEELWFYDYHLSDLVYDQLSKHIAIPTLDPKDFESFLESLDCKWNLEIEIIVGRVVSELHSLLSQCHSFLDNHSFEELDDEQLYYLYGPIFRFMELVRILQRGLSEKWSLLPEHVSRLETIDFLNDIDFHNMVI